MNFSENITRRVQLWIDNERRWHEMVLSWAEEIIDDPPQSEYIDTRSKSIYELADRMEEYFIDEFTMGANGIVTEEIARTALVYVEWDDIAERYISMAEERQN